MFKLSPLQKANLYLRQFARTKVRMIAYCRPKIVSVSEDHLEVMIPLNRRNKNHLNSMYFGTLSVGADVTSGFLAMIQIKQSKRNIQLAFKDFKADFLKRAEGDVYFSCHQGPAIKDLIQQAIDSGERQDMPVHVDAKVPSISDELVAKFVLTLSIKDKPT